MAKKTIKVGSFVEIQGFKNGHVDDIKNGYYYFNGIDERFTASDLKIIPDPPKPLKRTELKNAENPIAIKKHLHKYHYHKFHKSISKYFLFPLFF